MIVAIVSAIRTSWKFDGNEKDDLYFWRNAMSNIWYSSEIVGTIIVQCIPVLRPLLRDMKTSMTSKRLASTAAGTERQYASCNNPTSRTGLMKRRTPTPFPATIGSRTTHKAHIYSNAKDTFSDNKSETYTDSWDSQGIFQKKEFEMTTMDARPQSKDSLV